MTPEATPVVATHDDHQEAPERRHRNLLSIHPPVPVSEGEVVPAVLTLDVGERIHLAVPVGAFTVVQEKPCFVYAVDLVGLVAATLGIGVGALAVWRAPRLIRAIGDAEARRRGN
jgi:hypothetical protein